MIQFEWVTRKFTNVMCMMAWNQSKQPTKTHSTFGFYARPKITFLQTHTHTYCKKSLCFSLSNGFGGIQQEANYVFLGINKSTWTLLCMNQLHMSCSQWSLNQWITFDQNNSNNKQAESHKLTLTSFGCLIGTSICRLENWFVWVEILQKLSGTKTNTKRKEQTKRERVFFISSYSRTDARTFYIVDLWLFLYQFFGLNVFRFLVDWRAKSGVLKWYHLRAN